jgi:hypothetical protein
MAARLLQNTVILHSYQFYVLTSLKTETLNSTTALEADIEQNKAH